MDDLKQRLLETMPVSDGVGSITLTRFGSFWDDLRTRLERAVVVEPECGANDAVIIPLPDGMEAVFHRRSPSAWRFQGIRDAAPAKNAEPSGGTTCLTCRNPNPPLTDAEQGYRHLKHRIEKLEGLARQEIIDEMNKMKDRIVALEFAVRPEDWQVAGRPVVTKDDTELVYELRQMLGNEWKIHEPELTTTGSGFHAFYRDRIPGIWVWLRSLRLACPSDVADALRLLSGEEAA